MENFFSFPPCSTGSLQEIFVIQTTTTRLLIGGAVLYGLYQLYKIKATGNLVFYPGKVENISFIGSTPFLMFSLIVQNTASVEVVINSLAGNVYTKDGNLIGNVSNFEPIIAPSNGQTTTIITAQLGALAVVNDLIRVFQYKNFQETINFEGSANVGGVQVPLTLTFTIGA